MKLKNIFSKAASLLLVIKTAPIFAFVGGSLCLNRLG